MFVLVDYIDDSTWPHVAQDRRVDMALPIYPHIPHSAGATAHPYVQSHASAAAVPIHHVFLKVGNSHAYDPSYDHEPVENKGKSHQVLQLIALIPMSIIWRADI